jgi:hypothetical protein
MDLVRRLAPTQLMVQEPTRRRGQVVGARSPPLPAISCRRVVQLGIALPAPRHGKLGPAQSTDCLGLSLDGLDMKALEVG